MLLRQQPFIYSQLARSENEKTQAQIRQRKLLESDDDSHSGN
jgi:hypothetical protein